MKRKLFIITLAAAVFALAACGSKENVNSPQTETTISGGGLPKAGEASPEDETTAPETTAHIFDEDAELNYTEGLVTEMADGIITVQTDDGSSLRFDISQAEREDNDWLLPTSYVEVDYYGDLEPDVTFAYSVFVMNDFETNAMNNGVDPVLYGTVQSIDVNELDVRDYNGVLRTFNNMISRKVSFGDITEGTEVMVTYAGTLVEENQSTRDGGSGEPIAIKIVAMDAAGSEEAALNYIEGTISTLYADAVEIDTSIDSYTFLGDASKLQGFAEGDDVKVYYTGSFGDRSLTLDKLEKTE